MNHYFFILAMLSATYLGAEGTCKKCEALRKYHDENPCPYTYYDDYLKAVEEKKEIPKEVNIKELLEEQDEKQANPSQ